MCGKIYLCIICSRDPSQYPYTKQPKLIQNCISSNSLKATAIKKSPQRGGHSGSNGGGGAGGGGSTSPPGGRTMSTPSSTDDMNSSLLKPSTSGDPNDSTQMNNNMFGHFKGFTLKPLPPVNRTTPPVAFVHPVSKTIDTVPNRVAPPVPKPSTLMRKQSQITPVDTMVQQIMSSEKVPHETAPPLPPFNPGSAPRPIISSPILEASTCSAKELISPLRHTGDKFPDTKVPLRPAPAVPPIFGGDGYEQPIRSDYICPPAAKPTVKDSAIKRIASFLRKDEKIVDHHTLPKKLKPSIDKDKLKTIEISSPIPTSVETSDAESDSIRLSITRTQSMRDPSSQPAIKRAANIQTFGSMRSAKPARPGSMIGTRPKSPPPPRPPAPPAITGLKICGVPGYQNPVPPKRIAVENEYDDCEAIEAPLAKITEDLSPTNSDNIYSVIDEYERPPLPPTNVLSPTLPTENSGSMGLLGEIVNEIENRNLDSIYSVSTLARKKKERTQPAKNALSSSYSNTTNDSNDYGSGDSDYINMKSNSSTTSSGYLRPSAINAPIARVAPVKSVEPPAKPITNNLSSFKRKDDDIAKPPLLTLNSFRRPPTTVVATPLTNGIADDALAKVSKPVNKYLNNRPTPIGAINTITVKPTTITPATVVSSKPSSPIASKKAPFSRTKTPPSLQSSTRIRTRSPSPSQPTSKTSTVTGKSSLTKSTDPDLLNNVATANKGKQQPDVLHNTIQQQQHATKPKPLTVKPTADSKTSPAIDQQKPKWQSTGRVGSVDSKPPFAGGGGGGSGGIGANKLNRPFANSTITTAGGAKSSNIASLQKRFETSTANANKDKVNATTAYKK